MWFIYYYYYLFVDVGNLGLISYLEFIGEVDLRRVVMIKLEFYCDFRVGLGLG